jgi:hypothetical protein
VSTAIISGAIANKPSNGGNTWSRMSWVTGLRRLGFEVCFVEQISRTSSVDAAGAVTPFASSVNLAYFRDVMEQFGLAQSSALIFENGEQIHGLPLAKLAALAQQSSLLFNISGHLTQPDIKNHAKCKVYYDDDPGFTQFWHAASNPGARLADHDFYFTIGENIGAPDCPIPTGDIYWRHTRPPVVLEEWPAMGSSEREVGNSNFGERETINKTFDRFTTVASWRGAFGPVQYDGKTYRLKVHEFRKFIELPRRSGRKFEIALLIHASDQKDLDALLAHDWQIADPKQVAGSPDDFRRYVQTSGAEFSVAQGIYVDTNSGWFSDRTVRYLASGKPALVQDTGFSRHIPVGEGLLTFRTMDEAVDGAERIVRDYPRHCRAARRLAEEYFDSNKVIAALATEIGLKLP